MQSTNSKIAEMFTVGSASVFADHLDSVNHPAAIEIRYLDDPLKALRRFAKHITEPAFLFSLPIDKEQLLDTILRNMIQNETVLFTLGCDFADHVLPIFTRWNPHDKRLSHLIDTMRLWIGHNCKTEELKNARLKITNYRAQRKLQNIPAAPKKVMSTALTATNPSAWATHCRAAFGSADAAKLARQAAGAQEIEWQFKHVKTTLAALDQ